MMGIKAGRLAISQYFDQYQAGWQTALSKIYIVYMEMAERYCHIRRNFSFILYLAQWHFCFQILLQSGIGKIRASPIPEISDISILENETPDRSPILITGARAMHRTLVFALPLKVLDDSVIYGTPVHRVLWP